MTIRSKELIIIYNHFKQHFESVMSHASLICYEETIYFHCHQNQYLFSRGFIDHELHLSSVKSVQCQFRFEQKNYQIEHHRRKNGQQQMVVFGTEILIKHVFSNYYVSFSEDQQGNDSIALIKEPNQSCYFQLIPQRSFQHKGDPITVKSSFSILHANSKSYLGSNIFEVDPIKNKIRMELKNTKILQSYHLTRQISEEEIGKKAFAEDNDMLLDLQEENLKESMKKREELNKEIILKTSRIRRTGSLNNLSETGLETDYYLPIQMGKNEKLSLIPCSIEKHAHTMWLTDKKEPNSSLYLQDNDYIYFVSSFKNKGTMVIEEGNNTSYNVEFVNKQENQYQCSAIFIVEIEQQHKEECIYLRHLITGKYFPFTEQNVKKKLKLVPLLPQSSYQNKLPPFHIYFDGQFFPKSFQDYQNTCGFWLNKVNKIEINEVLSLQGMPHGQWIPYLINYLDSDRHKKQELLRQFGLLKYLIFNVIRELKSSRQMYTLLFKMINQNKQIRKQMAGYIGELIKNQKKEFLIDIFSEIFNNSDNLIEKYIQSEHLNHQITDFQIQDSYSITYMRIFRLFCGHYLEPCERNQNVIYGLFFGSGAPLQKKMTESYLKVDRNKIDEKFKFCFVFKSDKEIKIQNCHKLYDFKEFSVDVQQYIRQYFYLLGDCLKQNKTRIEQLKSNHGYTITNLLDILSSKEYEDLHGPIINLINVAFLDPEYKYKLYVYIKDYDQICFNGSLVALQRNESIRRLLQFINKEKDIIKERVDNLEMLKTRYKILKEEKIKSAQLENQIQKQNTLIIQDFASTKFKRFLIMVKHSIQNGYWDSISNLQLIVDTFSTLYRKKEEQILRTHEDYEQVHEWKNYMDSTVLIIDIAILYLDIQINLCISNLITIKEDKVGAEIQEFVKTLQKDKEFRNRFDYFQLTDPDNEELMKKSLILSRKYYEIKSIILKKYSEDIVARKSGVSLKESIQFIKESIEDLKLNNNVSITKCKQYIEKCLTGINIEDLSPSQLLKNGYILKPVFKYSKIVTEFQTLTFKLGVIQILTESIQRYINLRSKQKSFEHESIYWKILLFYVLINQNKVLKKEIIGIRSSLISLVSQQNFNSYIALDILFLIYESNRSIIVSDREEIKQICLIFVNLMSRDNMCDYSSKNYLNVKINKMLYLIHAFLVVDGKKIKNNFAIVLNELFDKEVLITYICKLKSIENSHLTKASSREEHPDYAIERNNNYLFQILLYRLTETLEQKPEKMNFTLPSMEHIIDFIMMVGKKNISLIFSIYSLLGEEEIERSEYFNQSFKKTVENICQITFDQFRLGSNINKKEFSQYSDEIQTILIHFPILIRITQTIIEGSRASKRKMLQPLSPIKVAKKSHFCVNLLERLFLFNHYLQPRVLQKMINFVKDNINQLSDDELFLQKLLALDFQIVSPADLKQSEMKLTDINEKKKSHLSRLKRLDSKIVIRGSRNEGILQILSQIHEYAMITSNRDFKIQNAKQFINSLTFINKKDQNNLDPELKTFFLSFLINRFPSEPQEDQDRSLYQSQLQGLQNLLIDYGSGELVASMLQQKFKENYTMFINLFEYGNKLLEGGNQHAQNSFYNIFLRDHKNVTFENIKIIIQNSTLGLKFFFHSYPKLADSKMSSEDEIIYPEDRNIQAVKEKRNFSLILKRIFRFLQLLCENDNQLLKNYIYKQINEDKAVKYMSVNFLEIAINNFSQLTEIIKYNLDYNWSEQEDRKLNKDIIDDLLDVLLFILDFLIEVCQYPAFKNQVFICNTDFFDNIDLINELAALYRVYYDDNGLMLSIERKIVILLRGLLQEKNKLIIQSLMKKLNIEGVILFVKSSLDSINVKTREQYIELMSRNHDKLIGEIENVVDILIVTKSLGITLEEKMPHYFQIVDQIRKQIREIQVDFRGNLTTISFCYRPIFNYLSKDTKEYFINEFSKHESRSEKLKDIINMRHIINEDIQQRQSRKLIMSETATNNIFHFSITLCFVLVALELFFFSVNRIGIVLDHLESNIIHGVAFMQFLTSLIYFVLWGINISPITMEKIKEKHHKNNKQEEKTGWKVALKNYYILMKQIYLQEGSSLHAVLLLSVSICACFFQIRMYSFVLLYIFAKIQLLRDILSAISVTWRQLALVSLLSMAFNFIFGMMSINNYINVLYENESIDIDIDHLTSHCSTIITCIDSLFAQRIIGETPSRVGDSSHYGRLFSDAIYWAFFEIIIPNLTAAIIIDKFAELRNSKEKMQKEEKNKCLICFADKSSIERKGEHFENHKTERHCIWDYFFYLYYLQKLKSNTEYTGVQYWIVEQITNEKIEWFPLDQSQKEDYGEKKAELLFEEFKKKLEDNRQVLREILEE